MSTLERVLLHAHTVDVGVDDKRRTFPLPREGMAAVRSPVFRHAGSWRHAGMVRRAFHPIAPRRRCGAVASIVVECILLCIRGVSRHDDGLPPPPGWHLCGCCWRSPHVADTPVGEIRGYAQRQPLAGWRKCSPPVIISAVGGGV